MPNSTFAMPLTSHQQNQKEKICSIVWGAVLSAYSTWRLQLPFWPRSFGHLGTRSTNRFPCANVIGERRMRYMRESLRQPLVPMLLVERTQQIVKPCAGLVRRSSIAPDHRVARKLDGCVPAERVPTSTSYSRAIRHIRDRRISPAYDRP